MHADVQCHGAPEARCPPRAQLLDVLHHSLRRAERALRIVLVRARRAKHGHHGIADEFLDEAVIVLDRLRHRLEQRVLEGAQRFGVERLGQRREAGQIGEHHRDLAAVRVGVGLGPLGARAG